MDTLKKCLFRIRSKSCQENYFIHKKNYLMKLILNQWIIIIKNINDLLKIKINFGKKKLAASIGIINGTLLDDSIILKEI